MCRNQVILEIGYVENISIVKKKKSKMNGASWLLWLQAVTSILRLLDNLTNTGEICMLLQNR